MQKQKDQIYLRILRDLPSSGVKLSYGIAGEKKSSKSKEAQDIEEIFKAHPECSAIDVCLAGSDFRMLLRTVRRAVQQ